MKIKKYQFELLPIVIILTSIITFASLISLFSFNQMVMIVSIPAPVQGDLFKDINEKIGSGETADTLQQAVDAGMVSRTDLLNYLIVNQESKIIAGFPRELVGGNLGEIEKEEGISTNKMLIATQSPDFMIFSSWRKDTDFVSDKQILFSFRYLSGRVFNISFIFFWLLLVLWVYLDARKRSLNAPVWGILILLTSAVGWAVYMITRPKYIKCPGCGMPQDASYKICPQCAYQLKITCPECRREIKPGWNHCAECGAGIAKINI